MEGARAWLIPSVVAAVGIAAFVYGSPYVVPDLGFLTYGFPFTWGVHTTMTIAGPADMWTVNLGYLTIDLISWFVAVVLSAIYARDALR